MNFHIFRMEMKLIFVQTASRDVFEVFMAIKKKYIAFYCDLPYNGRDTAPRCLKSAQCSPGTLY